MIMEINKTLPLQFSQQTGPNGAQTQLEVSLTKFIVAYFQVYLIKVLIPEEKELQNKGI